MNQSPVQTPLPAQPDVLSGIPRPVAAAARRFDTQAVARLQLALGLEGTSRGSRPSRVMRLRPGRPGPRRAAPGGGTRRRSVSSANVIGSSASISRTTPSPPQWRPAPPDPRLTPYSWTRKGNSTSSASIGVLSVLLIATWTADGPSASGQAPCPPPIVS